MQEESLSLTERTQISGGLWHQTCNLESYNTGHNKKKYNSIYLRNYTIWVWVLALMQIMRS